MATSFLDARQLSNDGLRNTLPSNLLRYYQAITVFDASSAEMG
jgi:hypothetical protein